MKTKEEIRELKRLASKRYNNSSKGKQKRKEYKQRPEVKQKDNMCSKKYNHAHKKERNQYAKKYYQKHKEELKQKAINFSKSPKGKQYTKEYQKGLKYKQYQKKYHQSIKYKQYQNQYSLNKYLNDPNYVMLKRLRNRLIKALNQHTKTGKIYSSKKYGLDFGAIIKHLGECPGKRSNYEISHIKPLHTFDLSDLNQVRVAFSPKNHEWLTIEEHKEVHSS